MLSELREHEAKRRLAEEEERARLAEEAEAGDIELRPTARLARDPSVRFAVEHGGAKVVLHERVPLPCTDAYAVEIRRGRDVANVFHWTRAGIWNERPPIIDFPLERVADATGERPPAGFVGYWLLVQSPAGELLTPTNASRRLQPNAQELRRIDRLRRSPETTGALSLPNGKVDPGAALALCHGPKASVPRAVVVHPRTLRTVGGAGLWGFHEDRLVVVADYLAELGTWLYVDPAQPVEYASLYACSNWPSPSGLEPMRVSFPGLREPGTAPVVGA